MPERTRLVAVVGKSGGLDEWNVSAEGEGYQISDSRYQEAGGREEFTTEVAEVRGGAENWCEKAEARKGS
jgi:hypothetical protein